MQKSTNMEEAEMCSTSRQNTKQRWNDALKRGVDENLTIFEQVGGREFLVTSSSIPGAAYLVTEYWCSCEAAKHGDPVCKHRAVVLNHLGKEPYIPVAPAPNNELELLLQGHGVTLTAVSFAYKTAQVEVQRGYGNGSFTRVARTGRTIVEATRNAIKALEEGR